MAKASLKHIHQFERVDIGTKKSYIVYKCSLPNCATYQTPELTVGKLSLCPSCGEVFVLQRNHLQLAKPHCEDCKNDNHWKRKQKETSREVVSEAFAEILMKHKQSTK